MYETINSPINYGGLELKNRIIFAPTTFGLAEDEYFEKIRKIAAGGCAMVIIGDVPVGKSQFEKSLFDKKGFAHYQKLVEIVHSYDCRICAQLHQSDSNMLAMLKYVPGVLTKKISMEELRPLLNAEVAPYISKLSTRKIHKIINGFGEAAVLAVKAGFDMVQVHGDRMCGSFSSTIFNHRTDEYGGSFENRARYACEIVQTIRKVVGPKFPILFRISLDHRFNGGRTLEDSVPLLGILEKAGVDAFDVDVASYEHLDLIYPTVYYGDSVTSYVCKEARKHVSVPIINGGSHTMETAVDLLESGDADIIQFGRQLIADPDFPNKLKDNRRDDIRPCLLCNEECIGRIMGRQSQLSCTVNIQACMEGHYQITKLPEPKNVVVIGAGPGGLEAARVAAMRGCKVTLFEKSGKIGGNFGTIASVGFKHRIRDLIWWYNNQLNKLGVDLRLNTEITADDPILGSADAIFLATGSVPLVPPIPGADLPNVMTVLDYHRHGTDGQNIVICGGGLSGCDAAIELHGEGKNVSIIEMQDDIAKDAQFINSITIHELMKEYGIALHTSQRVVGIEPDGVRVVNVNDGTESKIAGDTVLAAFGQKSNTEVADKIYAKYHTKCNYIGDCNQVGKSGKAIRDGFYAAMGLQ